MQVPLAMKRLMQGMKVNWEGNPAQTVIPEATPLSPSTAAKKVKHHHGNNLHQKYKTREIFQESATTRTATDGIVHKWIAQLVIAPGSSSAQEINDRGNAGVKQETMTTAASLPATFADTTSSSAAVGFGAITNTLSSAAPGASQKRKRTDPSHNLTPMQLAYRKKMFAEKQHEKVYFLGKFDLEADARAVLAIVSDAFEHTA
jgi:hypothetical protein